MSAHTMPNANFKSFQKPVHVSMRLALLSRFTFPGHTVLCLHLVYAIEGQNVSRLGRKFRKIGIFTTFLPTPGPNGAKARAQGVQGMEVMRQLQETPPSTTTVEPFIKRASPLATYSTADGRRVDDVARRGLPAHHLYGFAHGSHGPHAVPLHDLSRCSSVTSKTKKEPGSRPGPVASLSGRRAPFP